MAFVKIYCTQKKVQTNIQEEERKYINDAICVANELFNYTHRNSEFQLTAEIIKEHISNIDNNNSRTNNDRHYRNTNINVLFLKVIHFRNHLPLIPCTYSPGFARATSFCPASFAISSVDTLFCFASCW